MKTVRFSKILTLVMVFALGAGVADAGTLFSQSLYETWAGHSSNTDHVVIADNFSLAAPGSITAVTWYGYYNFPSLPASMTTVEFDIAFHADDGGLPAVAPLSAQSVSATFADTGLVAVGSLAGHTIYEFNAVLSPVALGAATPFWIVIAENDPATDSLAPLGSPTPWLWSRSHDSPIDGWAMMSTTQPWTLSAGNNAAFTLQGAAGVPLPSAAWLGLALLGTLAVVRKIRTRR